MTPFLLAALLLGAAPARANIDDSHPDCNAEGYQATLDACGNGQDVGSPRCRQRLDATVKRCYAKIGGFGEDDNALNDRIQTLKGYQAIEAGLHPSSPGDNAPAPGSGGEPTGPSVPGSGPPPGGFRVPPGAPGAAVSPLVTAAQRTFLGGEARQALRLVDQALSRNPDDADALRLRAQISLDQGDRKSAAADARRILQLAPDDGFAHSVLGNAAGLLKDSGRLKGSKLDFEPKDDGEPGLPGGPSRGLAAGRAPAVAPAAGGAADIPRPPGSAALVEQLQTRAQLGDWSGVLLDATRLVQLDPKDPRGWLLRARASNRLRNWAAAESDARKALELAPDDPAALLELGYAQLGQGRAAEALAAIDRALALAPANGLGHLYRAQALEGLGRRAEAQEEYRTAARLDPALKPLADAALALLSPTRAVPAPAASPAWRLPLRLVTGAAAGLLILAGLRVLWEARRRTTAPRSAPETPRGTPRSGAVLGGHYRVERELARGGMGVVLLATDTALGRQVAIKRLCGSAGESPEARRKFIQEAQLAARLEHPNLARIHAVLGEEEPYLVFELIDGEGLDAVLARRGRLTLEETRAVVAQACAALAHAHAARVIHRDLKPANMMVTRDGNLKLMDFGIAHEARTASAATSTQAWGTPPYMAPEQEDGYVLPASDLYALAVTAYELLAGRLPFQGPGLGLLKRQKSFRPLGGRDGLPAALDAFFARALDPDPARRFATAREFADAFAAVSGTPVRG